MFTSHIEVAESDENIFNRFWDVPEAVDGRREQYFLVKNTSFRVFTRFLKVPIFFGKSVLSDRLQILERFQFDWKCFHRIQRPQDDL